MTEAQLKPSFIGVSSRGFHTHGQRQGRDARTRNKCFLLLCNPRSACVVPRQIKELPLSKLLVRTYARVTSSLIKFSLSNRYSIRESRSLWGNVDLQVVMLSSLTQPWPNYPHQTAKKGNHLFRNLWIQRTQGSNTVLPVIPILAPRMRYLQRKFIDILIRWNRCLCPPCSIPNFSFKAQGSFLNGLSAGNWN